MSDDWKDIVGKEAKRRDDLDYTYIKTILNTKNQFVFSKKNIIFLFEKIRKLEKSGIEMKSRGEVGMSN